MSLPRVGREIAPAYFDRDTNTHEMLKGRHGAMDTVILGPDGNPLFTVANPARVKDADVESRLQSVETKLDSINQRLNQTLDTQLTGRNVEREIIFERSIRDTSTFTHVKDVPDGAIGLIAVCAIFGVTGEFDSGRGLSLQTSLRGPVESHRIIKISTNVSTQNRPLMVLCYPGVRMGDAEIHLPETRDAKIAGLPLTSKVAFDLFISGTFNSGEGFDCQLDVEWLY